MAILRTKPGEKFYVSVDFADALGANTIDGGQSSVTAVDLQTKQDVTSTVIEPGSVSVSGTVLQARVQNMTDGHGYELKYLCVDSAGNKFIEYVVVICEDTQL